ncbi:uncharacterized protein LOC111913576 isoform X3 [Lactuca sativa]|uniref:uncharacterized protein LOC111913576 isoform X3 n=1 Tax=Lactuca sativa TaxID=4236 RepID=UPI0022AF2CDF|nr:uncharacterized protein LOC111913576 isoform X3 [Lactuca sativa]
MICEKLLICYGYLHILLFFLVISSSGCSRYILSSQYLTSHQKEGFKDMFVVFGIILDYWLLDLVCYHLLWFRRYICLGFCYIHNFSAISYYICRCFFYRFIKSLFLSYRYQFNFSKVKSIFFNQSLN